MSISGGQLAPYNQNAAQMLTHLVVLYNLFQNNQTAGQNP